MRNFLTKFHCYLVVMFSIVCSCAPIKPISTEEYNSINKIGVISVLGNADEIQIFSPLPAITSKTSLGWNIDSYIEAEILKKLNETNKFQGMAIEYKKSDFIQVYEAHKGLKGDYMNITPIKANLQKIITENSLDAVILVISTRTGDVTLHNVDGFGILEKTVVAYKKCYSHIFAWGLVIDSKLDPLTHFSIHSVNKLPTSYCPSSTLPKEERLTHVVKWAESELSKQINDGLLAVGLVEQGQRRDVKTPR